VERLVKTLIDRIEAAFSDAVYPGDANLTDSKYGEEPEALAEDFRGKDDWKSLDPDFLNQAPDGWGSALSFFSAAALQFYLPAYLIADIRGTLVCGDATTRLCAFLTPQMEARKIARFYGGGTPGEHARAEFASFTPEQVSAIVAYLWWKLDTEGYNPTIEQALENYWLEREAASMQKA
jgi:hypothetical protein